MPQQSHADSKSDIGEKEPSLGPACLVITIVLLATMGAVCAFGSWLMFSRQTDLAVKAVEKQLIPWIESSQLSDTDKAEIVVQLENLVPEIEHGRLDKSQMTRLRNLLQDNPVFLWGGIQVIESQSSAVGLSETEVETIKRINQRLLRMAVMRKLGRSDLEYTIQQLSVVSKDGSNLLVRSDLTADLMRVYMQRAETILNRTEIPNESFDKTPAQAFAMLLHEALHPPTAAEAEALPK